MVIDFSSLHRVSPTCTPHFACVVSWRRGAVRMSDAPLLPVGGVASLRYGPRFSREKLQLLEVDDALLDEIVRRGVVIKGAPDQEAVLCTATQTFALKKLYENSNELLLIPPSGVVLGERSEDASVVTASCLASAQFDLVEVSPPVGALRALLRGASYGAAHEPGGAQAAHRPGYSWAELTSRVLCSDAQLRAGLQRCNALLLHDRWLTLETTYARRLLQLLILTAQQHGWALDAVPEEAMVDSLTVDGCEPDVARHVLESFCAPSDAGSVAASESLAYEHSCALDARLVCTEQARALLERAPRWRASEFQAAWEASVPEGWRCDPAWLSGEAVEEGAGGERWLCAFPASQLPTGAQQCFGALFARKPRWTREEMEPYLGEVEEAGATVEGLLLAWCRKTQATERDTPVYTLRHTAA